MRSRCFLITAAIGAALPTTACGGNEVGSVPIDAGPDAPTSTCTVDGHCQRRSCAECPSYFSCPGGICVEPYCATDTDCPGGFCVNGACAASLGGCTPECV